MKKTTQKAKPADDLMLQILDLQRTIYRKAEAAGLARYLTNRGQLTVIPHDGNGAWTADISLGYQPNYGIEYKLTTPLTGEDGNRAVDRDVQSDLFVAHLMAIRSTAEKVSASRRAIKQATLEVIAEAAREGISLELLRIEPAPVLVFEDPCEPGRRREHSQVFYVHMMLPHDDAGTLTEDMYTIDAADAEEFADYLRDRTLPELRELVDRFSEATPA
ncbi:hypothetical protein [Sphingomonas sp. ABOLG]|uniref:hypothetical protein n=1 Tax=Sphingomonas sp. ABOLG TaxID=1985880 RepID=UPI0013DE66D8|nr:hypothetical protein [Sphingomonas sp. ABOLG]